MAYVRQCLDRGIRYPPLDCRNVGPIHMGLKRQGLLRFFSSVTALLEPLAESNGDGGRLGTRDGRAIGRHERGCCPFVVQLTTFYTHQLLMYIHYNQSHSIPLVMARSPLTKWGMTKNQDTRLEQRARQALGQRTFARSFFPLDLAVARPDLNLLRTMKNE